MESGGAAKPRTEWAGGEKPRMEGTQPMPSCAAEKDEAAEDAEWAAAGETLCAGLVEEAEGCERRRWWEGEPSAVSGDVPPLGLS